MSIKAMFWANKQYLPAYQKLVLIMLADRHNADTNRCDPSMGILADDCGMSKDTVRNSIKALCEKKLLTAHARFEGDVRLTNFYTFDFTVFVRKGSGLPNPSPVATTPPSPPASTPLAGSHPNQELNQEPLITLPPAASEFLLIAPAVEDSSRAKKAPTKHTEFREAFRAYFLHMNPAVTQEPWDGQEAAHLSRFLKKNSSLTLEQWKMILRHRARSPVNHAENLSAWIARALTWIAEPTQGGSNGTNRGGTLGNRKADAAHSALSRSLARDAERIAELEALERAQAGAGEVLPRSRRGD